jgi:hypothetical protein
MFEEALQIHPVLGERIKRTKRHLTLRFRLLLQWLLLGLASVASDWFVRFLDAGKED